METSSYGANQLQDTEPGLSIPWLPRLTAIWRPWAEMSPIAILLRHNQHTVAKRAYTVTNRLLGEANATDPASLSTNSSVVRTSSRLLQCQG